MPKLYITSANLHQPTGSIYQRSSICVTGRGGGLVSIYWYINIQTIHPPIFVNFKLLKALQKNCRGNAPPNTPNVFRQQSLLLALSGPFLISFSAKTPSFALVGEIWGQSGELYVKGSEVAAIVFDFREWVRRRSIVDLIFWNILHFCDWVSRLIGRRRDKVFSSEYFDFNFEHFVVLQVSEHWAGR